MVSALLLCSGLMAAVLNETDRAAYEVAKAQAGRDADAQIKLALWCEQHGLTAERAKHLALAVLIDPKNSAARGLMGLVAFQGRWQRPEQVQADAKLAAALAAYNGRRERMPNTADAHWKMALWCEENGLAAEAKAHLASVVRLDPAREAAWKRLGCRKVGVRWMTDEQIAAEKAEAEAQKQANKHWAPLLAKWRTWLGDRAKRPEAERLLAAVTDPRAVPAVWAAFGRGNAAQQAVAARVLGQIDAPASSKALAVLALLANSAETRRAAAETLKRRDPREYADGLIALLRDPIRYEVRPVGGPGSPGALFVKGERFNVQRLYAPPALWIPASPTDVVGYDAYTGLPFLDRYVHHNDPLTNRIPADQLLRQLQADDRQAAINQALIGNIANHPASAPALLNELAHQPQVVIPPSVAPHLRAAIGRAAAAEHKSPGQFGFVLTGGVSDTRIPIGQMMLEAQKAAVAAQVQLQNDVATVDAFNADVRDVNDRVASLLNQTAGQSLGGDREAWKVWWVNLIGYAYRTPEEAPVPTFVEDVPLAYQPQPVAVITAYSPTVTGFVRMSCFGAGTRVRTLKGAEPIESLRVGDRVLTQDLQTGALGYQPILVVHHNPPSPTFVVKLSGDTIVSSPFHRFWRVGRGWVMARDLKAGDTLRLLDGPATVESVDVGPVQPVFNLDVDEDHDFFAGRRGALVHDNTLPDLRMTPFDAAPAFATAATAK